MGKKMVVNLHKRCISVCWLAFFPLAWDPREKVGQCFIKQVSLKTWLMPTLLVFSAAQFKTMLPYVFIQNNVRKISLQHEKKNIPVAQITMWLLGRKDNPYT